MSNSLDKLLGQYYINFGYFLSDFIIPRKNLITLKNKVVDTKLVVSMLMRDKNTPCLLYYLLNFLLSGEVLVHLIIETLTTIQ